MGNMKKILTVVMISAVLGGSVLLSGCASIREPILELSREDLANADTTREAAKNLIEVWALRSGFIRAYLGDRISDMPIRFVATLDKLDDLYKHRNTLTDYGYGAVLGFHLRMIEETIRECLKIHAPELLRYLP